MTLAIWIFVYVAVGLGFLLHLVARHQNAGLIEMKAAARRYEAAALFSILLFTLIWPAVFVLANFNARRQ
ncbi:hypothetical protein [Mesorhizobium sp. M7A.F.Ca.MR.245.00.0.0]|uniref:hypothetical protein n=1 Tax=Mesorhizobium sp. M7A.F.Ca.MR.245.00.0.0 TaxID=2496778 RepID=UPI000FCC755A|nr:hypothetical protein [Mesorhizobium sp. M7A.F.Ca.MR.245.00.0.0]RUV23655.1 hypothetical protein EOB80_00655 [Mesorhizobium sp. M7A.F.Ca.MR.245.00.0.0]RUV53658.1 hypothetical protein EOB77_01335 [Mesorhizobium sp. M7A.F.Ca.MR.228.00.0.0]